MDHRTTENAAPLPDAGLNDDRSVTYSGTVNQPYLTPHQLEALRAILASNRQPVFRGEQYSFCRGWNEAFDFVEKTIQRVIGEDQQPTTEVTT